MEEKIIKTGKREPEDFYFCFQEKFILKLLREVASGRDLMRLQSLYTALTECESNFMYADQYYYDNTIKTMSGLSKRVITRGLRVFEKMDILYCKIEHDEKGRRKGRQIVFTPHKCKESLKNLDKDAISAQIKRLLNPRSQGDGTTSGRATSGPSTSGLGTLYKKDNTSKKDTTYKKDNTSKKNTGDFDKSPEFLDMFENLNKQDNSPAKNKDIYLSAKDYQLIIPLLKYWNALPLLSNQRLPTAADAPVTKNVKNACKYLKEVMSGKFFHNHDISDTSEYAAELKHRKITIDEVKEVIDKLNEAYKPENYPENKTNLPKSLSEMFLKYYSSKNISWFYEKFEKDVYERNEQWDRQHKNNIDDKILEKYLNIIPDSGGTKRQVILNRLNDIYYWYKDMNKRMGLIYSVWTKYDTHLSSFKLFTDYHIEYLKGYQSGNLDLNPGFLKLEGKAWQRFLDTIQDNLEINLTPSDTLRKVIIKNRKRNLIKYFGYKTSYFPNDGVYTQEELDLIKTGKYIE